MKYSKIKFLTFFAIICSIGLAPINDASAATTFVDAKDVSGEMSFPEGIAFNTDGTKMFVLDGVGDDLFEYTCTTAFDVSTCSVVEGVKKMSVMKRQSLQILHLTTREQRCLC